jgi:hypothetical protein
MSTRRVSVIRWLVLASGLGVSEAVASESAADKVTLRDGQVVLGEVGESTPRSLTLYVRRDWAREHVPAWAERWEKVEKAEVKRAVAQRRERLSAWRRDRSIPPVLPAAQDRITPWIDRELARLKAGDAELPSKLLVVHLSHGDVSRLERRPKADGGLLRQGWLLGFRDPESMTVDALKEALSGRGLDPSRMASPSVEALCPPQVEGDPVWLIRRAATEVLCDPGLRFIRYQGILLPDQGGEAAGQGMSALQLLPALGALLGDAPNDQLPAKLRALGASGRVGATVTELEIAPDLAEVRVRSTLWVRQGGERWGPAGARLVTVRPGDLAPDAGKGLAADPQVDAVFRVFEAIGLKEIGPDVKRKALSAGAAVEKALSQVRAEAQADLSRLALPVLSDRDERGKPVDKP